MAAKEKKKLWNTEIFSQKRNWLRTAPNTFANQFSFVYSRARQMRVNQHSDIREYFILFLFRFSKHARPFPSLVTNHPFVRKLQIRSKITWIIVRIDFFSIHVDQIHYNFCIKMRTFQLNRHHEYTWHMIVCFFTCIIHNQLKISIDFSLNVTKLFTLMKIGKLKPFVISN